MNSTERMHSDKWKEEATGITSPENPGGQNCYFCHYWTMNKKSKKPNKKAKGDKKSRKHAHREDSDEENSSEESGNDGDDNDDNDDNSDLFAEFDSAASQTTCGQKQVYLGISFWIVIDVPYSCMSDIDTNIRQLFIKSGMEINKCKPINPCHKSGNLEVYTASLCQVIKDHKNQFAKDLAKNSAEDFAGIFTEILHGQIMHNYHANRDDAFPNNPEFGSKVVRVTVCKSCPRQTAIDFTKVLQEIRYAGLSHDFVDKTTQVEDSISYSQAASLRTPATNKIRSAVGLIERVMNDLDYRLHDGEVYRKVPQAKFTFLRSSSVNDFVHALLSNPKMATVIAPQISSVISILCNSDCQIIRQIELDYNLIEVKPQGCCFNIELKKFVHNPLLELSVGKLSPRAYVSYTYEESKKPDPKPIIESLCNSFPDEGERRRFLRKYYQILLHGKFPQKTTKLCVVGPSDFAKCHGFLLFKVFSQCQELLVLQRKKHFSAHLSKPSTQVVFIDEWTSDSLCVDDTKKVLQGGLQIVPQKNKETSKCVYKSGFYITTNEMPHFGGVDDEAIRRRLAVFQTDPLTTAKHSTTKWLCKNCMQVFHYCAEDLKDQDLFSDNDEDEDMELDGNNSDEGALHNDFDRDDSVQLMSINEIATYEFSQDKLKSTVDKAEESTRLSVVPKKVLDELFLNMDHLEPKRWWNPHGMFQSYGDPKSAEYHKHTMLIAAGCWKQMGFSKRDLMHFKLRYENKWSGSDTFYDAWLINEGLRCTEFDYNLLIERYPPWEA